MPDVQPLSDAEIAEIEARANAATPGEWNAGCFVDASPEKCRYSFSDVPAKKCKCSYIFSDGLFGSVAEISIWNGIRKVADGSNDCPPLAEAQSNALFIAAARTDVPRLIATIRALQRERTCVPEVSYGCAETSPTAVAFIGGMPILADRECEESGEAQA